MRAARRLAATTALLVALGTSPAWADSAAAKPVSPPAPAAHHSSGGQEAGEIVGFIGLVGVLIAWSEGYGLLGGRHRRRAQVPAPGADKPDA